MATCYICGKSHAEYRRSVHVGNSYRTGFSFRGRVSSSTTSHYGVRSVCASCALSIDYNNRKNSGNWGWGIGGALIGISILILFVNVAIGFCGISLGVLIGYLASSHAHKAADEWYQANSNNYVDIYDLQQKEKVQQLVQEAKLLENIS